MAALYYDYSKKMVGCMSTVGTNRVLVSGLLKLLKLSILPNISDNYKDALQAGIANIKSYINITTGQLIFLKRTDINLLSFVVNFLTDKNFRRHLYGEDKLVMLNVGKRSDNKTTSAVSSVNTSVNNTISSTLNSIDPITKIAVSFTFTPKESNYNKSGFAFSNQSYSGSQTTFTLDSANNIIIKSDGDPFPALAGNPTFTNDYANNVPRIWSVPNPLTEQNYNYTFPYRGGTNTSNPQDFFNTGFGVQGVFANGVALYNPSSGSGTVPGTTISGNNKYNLNAIFFEEQYGIDAAGGHPSPEGNVVNKQQGQYHYHDAMFLSSGAWNNSTFINSNSYFSGTNYNGDYLRHSDGHSKILGICFDGYPVYGPYGYTTATDTTSPVILMQSCYVTKATEFTGRPYTYTQVVSGTNTDTGEYYSYEMIAGAFLDDYYDDPSVGTLDKYNGRYCVTPDYPSGTYAYFITVDENFDPVFPYIIGTESKQQRTVKNNGYVG